MPAKSFGMPSKRFCMPAKSFGMPAERFGMPAKSFYAAPNERVVFALIAIFTSILSELAQHKAGQPSMGRPASSGRQKFSDVVAADYRPSRSASPGIARSTLCQALRTLSRTLSHVSRLPREDQSRRRSFSASSKLRPW